MTLDLIPRERREPAPGAVHLPDWLDHARQRALVRHCRRWAAEGPGIRAAALPNGARMSVKIVCLGWHWMPYRYSRTRDDQDGSPVTPFPAWPGDLGRTAVPCLFRLRNPQSRGRPWTDVELRSGDLIVFGDASRTDDPRPGAATG